MCCLARYLKLARARKKSKTAEEASAVSVAMAQGKGSSKFSKEHVDSHFGLMNTIFSFQAPLMLRAVVLLDIPRIISKAGRPLSVAEIISQIPNAKNPQPELLARILDYLVHKKLFSKTHEKHGEPRYDLTHFSNWFSSEHIEFLLLCTHPRTQAAYQNVHKAILDGGNAFSIANNGWHVWEAGIHDKEYNDLLNKAMMAWSSVTIHLILENYDGFKDAKTLVDLGGGTGMCAGLIAEKYPHIKVINFDLPHIIETAPKIPGVKHVSGNAYDFVPEADTIMIKSMFINFHDDDCLKFLKSAYKALPKQGKLIVVELIHNKNDHFEFELDITMIGFTDGGKSRSFEEHKELLTKSGFSNITLKNVPSKEQVIEAYKIL